MKIKLQQKVKVACEMADITLTELAERIGTTQSAFSNKLKRGKFTQEDMEKIAGALGAEWKSGFYFPDGNKVD